MNIELEGVHDGRLQVYMGDYYIQFLIPNS